ncbi:MAG: cation diffusion facilitator family transporter [Acidimicrobiia bacterium]|nr:cation diffusion facilitator family transporter [Acidimicrobiia bacterium]
MATNDRPVGENHAGHGDHKSHGNHNGDGGHDHLHHRGAQRRALIAAFVLTAGFAVVQLVAGVLTGSLALLSDAGHLGTDALGLGLATLAVSAASSSTAGRRSTFGLYRLEILAALLNAVLLVGMAAYVLVESLRRIGEPPEIDAGPVLAVAALGLAVNVFAYLLLRPSADASLNVEGALLEVIADLVGSVAVLVGGVVILLTGWRWVDVAVGAGIGLWIVPRALRLGSKALRILLQMAPRHIDLDAVRHDLATIDGVVDVHDLHVWTLTSQMDVATAHLMVRLGTDSHAVLDRARELLESRHRLSHATLQVEPEDHTGCDEISW